MRKPLPIERRKHVRVSVAVTADVADAVILYAKRTRAESVSQAINRILERLAAREREISVYRNRENELTTSR